MKRVVSVLVVLVALTTGCSFDDGSSEVSGPEESHNAADVQFAQGMIPHHAQAVDMARLVPDRAESERVKELAGDIEAAQEPEIETMSDWLEDWDEPVETGDAGHDGMGGSGSGLMSEAQLTDLEAASGPEFDRLFLDQMTEHHRGAIEMAEIELDRGRFGDALGLAERIRETQSQEVETMKDLLAEVG